MADRKPEHWFRAKRYGYGWGAPVRKEGWITLGVFGVVYLAPLIWILQQAEDKQEDYTLFYLLWAFLCVGVLLVVVRKHGPKPEWRWGDKPTTQKRKKKS